MTDEALRRLERTRARSPADEMAYLTAAHRASAIPRERLEFAARLGDVAAAEVLGLEPQPRPDLSADALLPMIAGERIEPYVLVPLTVARALRKHWEKFSKSDRVAQSIAAAEAWLADPSEVHRLAASRQGRPLSASQWQDELAKVRAKGKQQLMKWNKRAHDQIPPLPSFAERFATQAAQVAGATSSSRAEFLVHEVLMAFDHNTHTGMDFFNYVLPDTSDLADSVASNIAAWALGRSAAHAATTRPRRPSPPPRSPSPPPGKRPKYLQDILDAQSKGEKPAANKKPTPKKR